MATTQIQSITLESFLKESYIDDSPPWEYLDGEIKQKAMPQIHHSRLQLKLAVKLDTQHPPQASHDASSDQILGTLIGAGIGALIGGWVTGGKPAQSTSSSIPKTNTPENLISTVPPSLKDLVDARAGQGDQQVLLGLSFVT